MTYVLQGSFNGGKNTHKDCPGLLKTSPERGIPVMPTLSLRNVLVF